ncbi:hypothetical protein V6N12_061564 [Hibiscus sabdariffa]|uniref:Phorbol-ester/DAG-type domain-containing protein n=1 Tax=Hibiscus sabdariffa TaxID=183260 RepID=A0ABR2DXF3_9ROSI
MQERNANMSTHFEIEYCHQGHPMIFYEALERDATCFVCRVEISDEAYASFSQVDHFIYKCQGCAAVNVGFAYVCYECDFVPDVKCATSSSWVPKNETQRLKDMEKESKLCLFNRHHKLDYANYAHKLPGFGFCSFCGLYLSGPVYRCGECGYSLHESCVGFPWEMQIHFHPLHLLRPLLHPPQRCLVCKYSFDDEVSYSCVQCDLHLHVDCAESLKHVLKSKSHIHDLYYFG